MRLSSAGWCTTTHAGTRQHLPSSASTIASFSSAASTLPRGAAADAAAVDVAEGEPVGGAWSGEGEGEGEGEGDEEVGMTVPSAGSRSATTSSGFTHEVSPDSRL